MPTSTDSPSVAVIGLGYIGLPTAAVLATHGATVVGVDVNEATVSAVNEGRVPFVEPDLEIAVAGAVSRGRLTAQTAVPQADVYIVAVPTPFGDGHAPDLSHVDAATDAIAPVLQDGSLVILESTSPPGTTERMATRLLDARSDLSLDGSQGRGVLHLAHCPERVLPGKVMVELVTNDRVVGGLTPEATRRAQEVYHLFCKGRVVEADARTAELTKLVENSYRDVNIAFANEVARVAEALGVDAWDVIDIANLHPRVNILRPGPGVGGHCIAVDPWFIVAAAPEQAQLIRTAREVNDTRPTQIVDRVVAEAERLRDPRVAVLGLAFKADIDDLRESPARAIVSALVRRLPSSSFAVVEPHIADLPPELTDLPNVELAELVPACHAADIVVVLVDHAQFRQANADELRLDERILIDTRGLWR